MKHASKMFTILNPNTGIRSVYKVRQNGKHTVTLNPNSERKEIIRATKINHGIINKSDGRERGVSGSEKSNKTGM